MTLKKIFFSGDVQEALFAESSGVERIMIDLEVLGKEERQGDLDTRKTKLNPNAIKPMSEALSRSKLMVRVNPINKNSLNEIDFAIMNGAEFIMLPMFESSNEVKKFISYVGGRAKTSLLLETKNAFNKIDKILQLKKIDEVHIGLNDLHLQMGSKFMFDLLADGTVKKIVDACVSRNLPFGIGGVAPLSFKGRIPPNLVLAAHSYFGSKHVILSRTFNELMDEDKNKFNSAIRDLDLEFKKYSNLTSFQKLEQFKVVCNNLGFSEGSINER